MYSLGSVIISLVCYVFNVTYLILVILNLHFCYIVVICVSKKSSGPDIITPDHHVCYIGYDGSVNAVILRALFLVR